MVWLLLPGLATTALAANPEAPARFKVATEVVNANVGPFSATIGAVGNNLLNYSFEPVQYRTRFFQEEDAADRVVASGSALTSHDTLREGFYEGAEVRVYRIINAKVEMVRRDRVAKGGSHLSGWLRTGGEKEVMAPQTTRCQFRFDDWNRPEVPYYFTVKAVDKSGNESAPAAAVRVVRPANLGKGAIEPATKVELKIPRNSTDTTPPPAPAGFKADLDPATGVITFTWSPVNAPDLAGYRLYRSDYAPEEQRGFGLVLEGKAGSPREQLKKGDWVVVAKEFTSFSRLLHCANRVWNASQNNRAAMPEGLPFYPDENPNQTWELERHPASSPVRDGGQTSVKFTLKNNEPVRFAKYNHAGTGQTWYEVLKPGQEYVVEVWLRQEGMADPTFTFSLTGFYAKQIKPMTFTATREWRQYTATFTPPALYEGGGGVGQMVLEFKGPGTVWMDNFRVYSKESPFLDYLPYQYESLAKSGMNCLRTHGFIKTGTTTYNMEQLTNPGGAISGVAKENTLPQILSLMRKAKVTPWLQVEMHMAPEEWLGFVEYLAAPYDPAKDSPKTKPWAAKRFAQGQAKPWTAEFDKILFEISNETWNWLFSPWVFESMTDGATGEKYDRGEVYGFFQEHIYNAMAASPYWKSAGLDRKLQWVVGGWAINTYGTLAASRSPHSRFLTIAAYNGGWDEGEGPTEGDDASLSRVLLQVPQTSTPRSAALRAARDELRAKVNPALELGTYEAGPGYALSGLNNQAKMSPEQVLAQERTMKSLGGGTATLDNFLDKAAHGFTLQNFFTFFHGRTHWVSHTAWHKGARPHPCWLALELFNHQGVGDFLKVETLQAPTVDVPAFKRRKAMSDVPLAACYASRQGNRLNLFLLSRKLDNYPAKGQPGFTPVTVELPFDKAAKITLHKISGNPRATNLDAENVKIQTQELPAAVFAKNFALTSRTGADDRGLPPGATFLYVFEGTSMPAK